MLEYKKQCWYPIAQFSVKLAGGQQRLSRLLPGMSVSLYGPDVSQVSRAVVHGPAELIERAYID